MFESVLFASFMVHFLTVIDLVIGFLLVIRVLMAQVIIVVIYCFQLSCPGRSWYIMRCNIITITLEYENISYSLV